jgi:hexokinase
MLTDDTKRWIKLLLPAADARSELLRRAVRLLATRDGVLSLAALAAALARPEHPLYVALTPWDGIRWEGTEGNITARLVPYVRRAIGLPVTSEELKADLGSATQDEDEPTAYHRPAPLQALFESLPAYTTQDVDALLNGPRYVTSEHAV